MKQQKAVISDIDGTLTIFYNDALKHYKDKDYDSFNDACLRLPPREQAINHLNKLIDKHDCKIIFMTGRPARLIHETTRFLITNFPVGKYELFMRPPADYRPSKDLKEQWTRGLIRNNYNIFRAYDDRKEILQMMEDKFHISGVHVGLDYFGGNDESHE
jgi:acid phosphatase class B